MKRFMKLGLMTSTFGAALALSTGAVAQEASASASGEAGMGLPSTQPATATAGDSDHNAMVGRLAVGYLGASSVPFPGRSISAPVVGVRYWIQQSLGLDVGLGFYNDGGSTVQTQTGQPDNTQDVASTTAVILHGGVPLSLAQGKHWSFQIVPELNIGFATQTKEEQVAPGQPVPETTNSGLLVDLGARAGAEVHFGFIGVPELSLQGGIGLFFTMKQDKTTTTVVGNERSVENTSTNFRTTVNGEPWDIFTGNIAALYYF